MALLEWIGLALFIRLLLSALVCEVACFLAFEASDVRQVLLLIRTVLIVPTVVIYSAVVVEVVAFITTRVALVVVVVVTRAMSTAISFIKMASMVIESMTSTVIRGKVPFW